MDFRLCYLLLFIMEQELSSTESPIAGKLYFEPRFFKIS